MRRRTFLGAAPAALRGAGKTAPHIVLFLADDHGWRDSPLYGNRAVRTPNLERLAAAGVTFSNAFCASPSCVPSRAVLMSGLMPARNGAEANHSQQKAGTPTLPRLLAQRGYRVAHFGKSHFLPAANYREMEFIPSEIRRGPLNNDLDPSALDRWLADRPDTKSPVCLVVGCHSPHVYWPEINGYDPARVDLPPTFVDTPETRDHRARYYTDISIADAQLGQVYDSAVKYLGANLLFLYTSDNGAQWPFGKWNLYDDGIRAPMVAAWPGVIRPGSRTAAMVSFADLLPTLLEASGGQTPPGLDGQSYLGVLRGAARSPRDRVFATHTNDGNMNVYPMRCVRTARFKYILNLHPEWKYTTHIDRGKDADGAYYWRSWVRKAESDAAAAAVVKRYHERPREELYDIVSDPYETRNLAQVRRDTAAALRRDLESWMKRQGDEGRVSATPVPLSP